MLQFKPILFEDLELIKPFLFLQNYRTCDFAIGAIFMWVEHFDYEYCINDGSLYIKGNDTEDSSAKCYALPLGESSISNRIERLLNETEEGLQNKLVLNTIPEGAIEEIKNSFNCIVSEMDNWFDYLYNANDLATFIGHKYNKKRNRINQFKKTYENYSYHALTVADKADSLDFLDKFIERSEQVDELEIYESRKAKEILARFEEFGFRGGVLRVGGEVVALTIGDIYRDTAFIHIEKANTDFEGAYQMICNLFAEDLSRNKVIKYINREEDLGDLGMRQSKQSYFPIELLKKFRVEIIKN